jgi:hypothetical protein
MMEAETVSRTLDNNSSYTERLRIIFFVCSRHESFIVYVVNTFLQKEKSVWTEHIKT